MERSGALSGGGAEGYSAITANLFATPPASGHGRGSPGVSTPGAGVDSDEFMKHSAKLKPLLIQAIEEVVGELETTHEDVAKGAREHIHSS